MPRLALMIDLERCTGCKSCEAACKSEHALGPTERHNRVVWLGSKLEENSDNNQALDLIVLAIKNSGFKNGKDVSICLDIAANELFKNGLDLSLIHI